MARHLTTYREGFSEGNTSITNIQDETGIAFSIIKLAVGETHSLNSNEEIALLHLEGEIAVNVDGIEYRNTRTSIFDEAPFAVHAPKNTPITIKALSDCELALFETKNDLPFPCAIYHPSDTGNERRGDGLVGNTMLRLVRTIFDNNNSNPNSQLVLGEVVNFPGKWSSYPPHHHPQPEIYHYRFTDPRGYGHAEMGEAVMKVQQYDTIKILDELDHAQCAAPGYGMYYIWAIRHLPDTRYTIPEFTEKHRWTMDPGAKVWQPKQDAAQ